MSTPLFSKITEEDFGNEYSRISTDGETKKLILKNQEKAEKFDEISDKDKCENEARANRWASKLDAVEQEIKQLKEDYHKLYFENMHRGEKLAKINELLKKSPSQGDLYFKLKEILEQ